MSSVISIEGITVEAAVTIALDIARVKDTCRKPGPYRKRTSSNIARCCCTHQARIRMRN